MKRALLVLVLTVFAPTIARAEVCLAMQPDSQPPFLPVCVEWGPSTPPGWTSVANGYEPVAGEIKICSKPGCVGGTAHKRAIPAGQNVLISDLGEYEGGGAHGPHRIRALWFKLSRDSTVYSQENMSCPTCVTVPAAPYGLLNGDIAFTIRYIVARN